MEGGYVSYLDKPLLAKVDSEDNNLQDGRVSSIGLRDSAEYALSYHLGDFCPVNHLATRGIAKLLNRGYRDEVGRWSCDPSLADEKPDLEVVSCQPAARPGFLSLEIDRGLCFLGLTHTQQHHLETTHHQIRLHQRKSERK